MEKKIIRGPAPEPPRTRSWSFSLSVTRSAADEGGETVLSLARRVTPLDLVLVLALLTLFVIEPFGVYLYLTRHGGLLSAESCAAGNPNVVVSRPVHQGPLAVEPGAGGAPGFEMGGAGDVITPLNVRDPSALVMGPGPDLSAAQAVRAPDPPRARRAADSEWKEALEAASERIVDPPKSKPN